MAVVKEAESLHFGNIKWVRLTCCQAVLYFKVEVAFKYYLLKSVLFNKFFKLLKG